MGAFTAGVCTCATLFVALWLHSLCDQFGLNCVEMMSVAFFKGEIVFLVCSCSVFVVEMCQKIGNPSRITLVDFKDLCEVIRVSGPVHNEQIHISRSL